MKQITQPFPLLNPSTFTEEYQNMGSKWKNKWNKQNLQPLHAAREKSSSQKYSNPHTFLLNVQGSMPVNPKVVHWGSWN